MQNVQLKFDSIQALWRFKEKMELANFEIQQSGIILVCELSDAAIELAIKHYGARRVDQMHPA